MTQKKEEEDKEENPQVKNFSSTIQQIRRNLCP